MRGRVTTTSTLREPRSSNPIITPQTLFGHHLSPLSPGDAYFIHAEKQLELPSQKRTFICSFGKYFQALIWWESGLHLGSVDERGEPQDVDEEDNLRARDRQRHLLHPEHNEQPAIHAEHHDHCHSLAPTHTLLYPNSQYPPKV